MSYVNHAAASKRELFGRKSETYVDPGQIILPLDDKSELVSDVVADNVIEIASHPRKKRGRHQHRLPKRVVIVPVDTKDRTCACGSCKTLVRYEVTEIVHYEAPRYELIEEKREVLACPKRCEQSLVTAPKQARILPKVGVSESFLSFMVVSKVHDRQPLYHLEQQLKTRYHLTIPRQSMAKWFIDLYKPLLPIVNLMKDMVIDYDVAALDATTLQVLNEPGRPPGRKSYAYCFRGGPPDKPVVLY